METKLYCSSENCGVATWGWVGPHPPPPRGRGWVGPDPPPPPLPHGGTGGSGPPSSVQTPEISANPLKRFLYNWGWVYHACCNVLLFSSKETLFGPPTCLGWRRHCLRMHVMFDSCGIVERESWMVQYLTQLLILSSWLPSLLTVFFTKTTVWFIIRARHCIKYRIIEQYWKFERVVCRSL